MSWLKNMFSNNEENSPFHSKGKLIEFISSDHIRYEHGNHISGPHGGARRVVTIEKDDNDPIKYHVALYNMDGNHPVWKNNVQMANKQMKVIEDNTSKTVLRGYGADLFGNTYSDYGITIYWKGSDIDKCVLYLLDRGVNLEYLK